MKRTRSAKGELVDFDILTIKAQIAAGHNAKSEAPTIEVKRQENFIDKKMKRQVTRAKQNTVEQTSTVDVSPPSITPTN